MKQLIIFYSLEGNTANIAKIIQEATNVDIFELKPDKEIPKIGFKKFLKGGMQTIFNKKAISFKSDTNLDDYDMLFIGTPVWAGSISAPLKSYIAKKDITNKKIAAFTTSGGPDEKCLNKLKKILSKNNSYIGGINIPNLSKLNEFEIKSKINSWLENLKSNLK